MSSSETSQVCSLPIPPVHYVTNYTDENIRRGRAPRPPPPIHDSYSMFGNTFNADDTIIRPLEAQGIKRLYPQHFDRRRELRKLNHSLLVNFLDLLDLLVRCPESPKRAEKVEDLSLLFIHIHHLLNEFRPHQARETLRVMMDLQKRQRIEIAQRFQKHLDKKSKSNATQLVLRKVGLSFSGRYSCEVSADAPSFSTAFVSGDMHVVIMPKSLPEVQGMKSRYKVGDTLKATCVSKHSKPAANITWYLNSQALSSDYIRQFTVIRDSKSDLETSMSTVSFKVEKEHFKLKGRLKVRCTASIHNIYWQTSENSAEEERPKASVVAAQDYRLHDIFRKPNEYDYEVTTPMASSINRHCDFSSSKSLLLPLLNIFLLYFCTSC